MSIVSRRRVIAAGLLCLPLGAVAHAQEPTPQTFETGNELLSAPARMLNTPVTIHVGYCFFDDTNTQEFTCIGSDTPFEVVASSIEQGPALDAIKANCAGIEGVEHNPSPYCAFSFNFTATSYKTIISDYVLHDLVQSDKPILQFRASLLVPFK